MKIAKIEAREVFNSRGMPTIECALFLDNGMMVLSSVPTGLSRGDREAHELHDGGDRLAGKGVLKAVELIEKKIAPGIVGKIPDIAEMDSFMISLDGTPNKNIFGANTLLAMSIAICRAQAYTEGMNLYEFIAALAGYKHVSIPYPMVNIVNGGRHAPNNVVLQEYMVVPFGAKNFRDGFELVVELFYMLKHLLKKSGKRIFFGIEGGIASDFDTEHEVLDFIVEAIAQMGLPEDAIGIALDCAATEFFDGNSGLYHIRDLCMGSEELIAWYAELCSTYPIYSLEDPLSMTDSGGWKKIIESFNNSLQIVGDDIFATNVHYIEQGVINKLAQSVVIKPNQIGTVTETLRAIQFCKEHDLNTIVSHRSGETEDTFIVDLAIATSAGQMKLGGCTSGERIAKYNHVLRIEDMLMNALLDD